jgi:acyl carrier protein
MTFEDWSTSIEAKLEASYNLDKLLPRGLDFFVLLSSLSGIIGLSGQANYAAGNAYQDGLARARIERGEHAVSLDLGAMDNVGVIAENEHVGRQARAQTLPIKEVEFHALLETFCLVGADRPLGEEEIQTLVGLHTPSFFRTEGLDVPPAYSQPFFSHVNHTSKQSAESSGMKASELSAINYRHRFKVADSAETAATVVVEGLVAKLSKALSAPEDSIDSGKPLYDYGVDSLVAVEIRNWFIKDFSSEVPIFSFLGAPSIRAVGDAVTEASTLRK